MLFDIDDDGLPWGELFDEFPGRADHPVAFTRCACGAEGGRLIATATRHRNFQPLRACGTCGTLRADPYFTPETAGHYYGQIYGPVKRRGERPETLMARQRAASLEGFLAPHLEGVSRILDFGGGAGGRTAGLIAPDRTVALHEVEGEYSAAGYAAGLERHVEGARYDLVVVSHVIEHLLDPAREMGEVVRDLCAPGGLLLVATPIIDRLAAHKWLRLLHLSHKYYFAHDALIALIGGLGGRLVAEDGVETYLFRLGTPMGEGEMAAANARGAAATIEAIAKARRRRLTRDVLRRLGG